MNLADFINGLPSPPDDNFDIPEAVAKQFTELASLLQITDDQEEIRRILLLNNRQELPTILENKRGASFCFVKVNDWPSMVMCLRPTNDMPARLCALALPPGREEDAAPFFVALVKAIQTALGVPKIMSRNASNFTNN